MPRFPALGTSLIVFMTMAATMAAKTAAAWSQQPVIPHAQDQPPNEPRDAVTAARMMTVPEGFVVEVVAAEPHIVNPVAMTFDEKGRVWVTESLEYPRKEAGPGRDRVKVLEDTDGDGAMDRYTTFLEGLNIPSGIAVGHGGVWVANSPDILFVPDSDRDGKPDGEPQVVVTGFGRTDTHELPNSLTWGPDGWLYGLNGVFNHSHVRYPESSPHFRADHPGWPLTCAMFRIHPRTREFQVFAEGTSNPWGIAFNDEGDAFVSACVIDHLWHIVETGSYHRQGGPYPPHTWKMESIVEHKHQKAAYCGITWFDSDAYPENFRRRLYMGNIHGGCINVDRIERNGSTYRGFGDPDFLVANDAWFMPVVQKTGPDGCLWILDWYDRYHCYQDANRDPAGIDRLKGRLYRVRYTGDAAASSSASESARRESGPGFDVAAESDDQLIEKLGHPNVWMRETAQRILQERNSDNVLHRLRQRLLNPDAELPVLHRRHLLFSLAGCSIERLDGRGELPSQLFRHPDPIRRAWAVRAFGDQAFLSQDNRRIAASQDSALLISALHDDHPAVRLQGVIATGKSAVRNLRQDDFPRELVASLRKSPDDLHLARIVWQALKPLLSENPHNALSIIRASDAMKTTAGQELAPRIIEWMLSQPDLNALDLSAALDELINRHDAILGRRILSVLTRKVQSGELTPVHLEQVKSAASLALTAALAPNSTHPLQWEASLLSLSWKDPLAVTRARTLALDIRESPERRMAVISALIAAGDRDVVDIIGTILKSQTESSEIKSQVLQTGGRLEDAALGTQIIASYDGLAPDVQPKAVELLTQRANWAKLLLAAIGVRKIRADVIHVNQARRLHEFRDDALTRLLQEHWGDLRDGRSPDRERVVAEMKSWLRNHRGDPIAGALVYKKVCGQCHKLYGEGAEVGPDLTRNGRNDYQQLLSNVFDPNLVIGSGYRSYTVLTSGGRVINGLLAEDSPQRLILRVQGGRQEVIPRSEIDEFRVSDVSLMPEQLEKQITLPEIADLFAYVTLDRPPDDPEAKRLPGVYEILPRETTNPLEFSAIMQEAAPGFTSVTSGEQGVGLLTEYRGRKAVVRTHPVSRDQAAIIGGRFLIPQDRRTKLIIEVSHDERGDWRLLAGGRGERLLDEIISAETCSDGWATFEVDLTKFAGQEVEVQIRNQANNWAWEFAYWGSARIVSE